MIRLEADQPADVTDVAELFAIGDQVYTVPAKPRVNIALRYLRDVRKMGPALAESALLEAMLGPEGYEALCDYDGLKTEHMEQITETAAKLALGALEDQPEGNDDGGSAKSAG